MKRAPKFDIVLFRYSRSGPSGESTISTFQFDNWHYLAFWLYFIFVTSVVVTNAVKGTTVAFLLAYGALVVPLFTEQSRNKTYYQLLIKLLAMYLGLCVASQVAVLLSGTLPAPTNLILISPERSFFLRTSLFTQSLYVIPSFALGCFVALYYTSQHDKHLIRAIVIFVAIGFYKVLFYQLFGLNGDFLSNRMFGDGIENPAQFQLFILGGREINRFVSLTGEPSMYVFATFPYFVYFLYRGQRFMALFLLSSLMLTFSGTFAMALFLLGLFHFLLAERSVKRASALVLGLVVVWVLIPAETTNALLKEILFDKINQESTSGIERTQNFVDQMAFYNELPFLNKLVGVGFGTIRSTDLFSTLLVNTGIVGQVLFTILFAWPVYKLPRTENGLRIALLITYFILQISVSEYSYPSLWLLLGLAYNIIFTHERLRQRALSNAADYGHTTVRH